MRTWIIAILVAASLAGCSDAEAPPQETPEPVAEPTAPAPAPAPAPQPAPAPAPIMNETEPENTAPSAAIAASVLSGQVPATISFTLDGADSDGDMLTWMFDANGNGTADAMGEMLPSMVNYTYSAAGIFNATLWISDGMDSTTQVLSVNISAAPAPVKQVYSGSTTASIGSCPVWVLGFLELGPWGEYPSDAPLEGTEWLRFEIDPATRGQNYAWSLSHEAPEMFDVSFNLYDQSGKVLQAESDGSGMVPANASFGVFWPCGPGPVGVSYESAVEA